MKADVVVVGSLNMDLVIKVNRKPEWGETLLGSNFFVSPGGKGGNQAYAAAKFGGSVAMLGCVGDDLFGEQLIKNLAETGTETAFIKRIKSESTGVAMININPEGDNSIIVAPGANNFVTPEYVRKHEQVISQAKIVMVQLEIPIETVVETAKLASKHNVPFMLDPAPARVLPEELYNLVDYILPNENEIREITRIDVSDFSSAKKASRILLSKGIGTVLSKLGGKGVVVTGQNQSLTLDGHEVPVVDTTAAGDAFAGAFATALVDGKDLKAATQFANAVGALTVTRAGAQASMPDLDETMQFIEDAEQ
ncbi:ribokinase [Bacillus freudenreichii]|nr:ribokinase [Bacillus freudenreichii]